MDVFWSGFWAFAGNHTFAFVTVVCVVSLFVYMTIIDIVKIFMKAPPETKNTESKKLHENTNKNSIVIDAEYTEIKSSNNKDREKQ